MSFFAGFKAFCLEVFEWLKVHGQLVGLAVFEWLKVHAVLVSVVSVVSFVGGLLFCALFIAWLPFDYFLVKRRVDGVKHPVLRVVLILSKNVLAVILVIVGTMQLVLPGQGVLTILIGFVISDIPGKRRLERRLIRLPAILSAANHIRARFKREPLVLED